MGSAGVLLLFVAFSAVALMAVPVVDGQTALGSALVEAPVLGVVAQLNPDWLAESLRYAVGSVAAVVLAQAANGQMLGIGRLAYSLGVNRQIPSAVSRLGDRYSTPYVTILVAAALAFGLALSDDVEFLAGIFAFGAMLAFTIAHLSVIVLRFREPDRVRPFRGAAERFRAAGCRCRCPPCWAWCWAMGWATAILLSDGARVAGTPVDGRRPGHLRDLPALGRGGRSLSVSRSPRRRCGRSRTPPTAASSCRFSVSRWTTTSSGTAGRLASEDADEGEGGAVLEALYVFEIPMSLPIDARVSDERVDRARQALARAKEVGEEYEGVEVATAMARGRAIGAAIVTEAKRRGVEAIVLAAEAPSRIRGGCDVRRQGARARTLRGRHDPLRDREGALQGDPHRAAL